MTTPQIPANPIDISDVRDEINPGDGSGIQQNLGSNVVIRRLTGSFDKNKTNTTEILLGGDLSFKTAFSEITVPSLSNTQTPVIYDGNPGKSTLTLTANTDMFEPNISWSYAIQPDSVGVVASDLALTKNIEIAPNGRPFSKSANLVLTSAGTYKSANVTVTGVMTVPNYDSTGTTEVGTHTVNTCSKNIRLVINPIDTQFQVTASPSFTVDATGVEAQTATIILTASSNPSLSGITYKFLPSYVSGSAPFAPFPVFGQRTVTFTATATSPSTVNSAVWSVTTEMYQNGTKIRTLTSDVNIRAEYISRQITSLTPAALSNNQFSNSSSQYSTIDITAVHNSVAPSYPQGTVTFTLETTGDPVTQQTISSTTSSKVERISLYHDVATSGFGFKKAVVVVVATLRAPNGTIMDQKRSEPITLRAGTYGLTLVKPPSNTQIGLIAQTATSSGSATWGAGTFAWGIRQFNGTGPTLTQDNQAKTSTINIVARTKGGKDKSQPTTNSCSYDLTATLTYDGVTVTSTVLSDIFIKAESQPYTFSISAAGTANVQSEVDSGTTASILVTAVASTGTVTWTRDNPSVGLVTTSTTANVFVTSPSSGGSNVKTTAVYATLLDGSSRTVEIEAIPSIELDATTTKLRIIGESVSVNNQERSATATGIFESASQFGTHSLVFPPAKLSGNDLELAQDSSTKQRIIASAIQTSKSGTYRITGRVDYRGIIRTVTKDVTISATAVTPTLVITKNPYTYSTYTQIGSVTGFGGEIAGGGIGSIALVTYQGVDLVVATNYPGNIKTGLNPSWDFEIRRVVNVLGNGFETAGIGGPFFNETANLPIVNPSTGLPTGNPDSTNKRRDRVFSTLLTNGPLVYNITYELRDTSGTVLTTATVSDSVSVAPPSTGQVSLTFVSAGAKTFTIQDKPNNGFGFMQVHPLEVRYQQTVNYSATYSSTAAIPTPRFAFTLGNSFDNQNAVRSLSASDINGQAAVTVTSIYNDNGPTITDSRGLTSLAVQLTSKDPATNQLYYLGEPKSLSYNYELPIPPGRAYKLSVFSTYGVRQQHTRDPFGNSFEVVDYSKLPDFYTLEGPETKWIGFHDGSRIYEQSNRPLYAPDGTRYYSSEAHRTAHQALFPSEVRYPSKIIPTNYFVVMAFSETGSAAIGQISMIGNDNNVYSIGIPQLWAAGAQNDRSRDNDAFDWFIFTWVPPAGVTVQYAFISNKSGSTAPPPFAPDPLSFTAVQPGNILIGQQLNLNIGTVGGGFVEEDIYVDVGGIY